MLAEVINLTETNISKEENLSSKVAYIRSANTHTHVKLSSLLTDVRGSPLWGAPFLDRCSNLALKS